MKKIISVFAGLMVVNLAFANFPPIPSLYASISVLNNTRQTVQDKIKINDGTLMKLAPNPIFPGVAEFKNIGDPFEKPGFQLTIGSDDKPNGQCIVAINYPISIGYRPTLTHPADGSAGFTCHLTGKNQVELDPTRVS